MTALRPACRSPGAAGKEQSCLYFSDNAPSWETLGQIVSAQQKELNLEPADLAAVRPTCWSSCLRSEVDCWVLSVSPPKVADACRGLQAH